MITEINHEAVAMAQRIKEATLSGNVAQQLHWARELELDALVRGATGELTTEVEFNGA